MKKEQFDFKKANARKREIGTILAELGAKIDSKEKREKLTDEEFKAIQDQARELKGELESINMGIAAALANQAAEMQGREVTMSKNAVIRELLNDIRTGKRQEREISLGVLTDGATNNITSSGATPLVINDLLPRLTEGLIWDKVGMKVQTGVRGNIIWPYATDNVKVVEVGETVQMQDQDINFDNIKAEPTECGATIKVSFAAIEDASFDVLTFIQASFDLAMQDYLNWKSFSHAAFTGIKGPWSGKVKQTAIEATYKNILNAKAELINKGVNMNGFCYVMDAKTEALLKSIVKAKGQGGFIIEDGKLDGDPYFVSHYIQQQADGKQDTANMYLGLGVWAYLAANQHGDIHLIIDPYTLADKGMMKITMRTRWSLTTLRPEAFACYKITEPTEAANGNG